MGGKTIVEERRIVAVINLKARQAQSNCAGLGRKLGEKGLKKGGVHLFSSSF